MARPVQKQSIYKIAQEAGVSISAVSCAINNRPGLSDETRKRIAAIVDQAGYTRNYRRTDGRTIGMVLPGTWKDWYISAIVNGVIAYIAETNINIATIIYHPGHSKSLLELLREHCCDAAVIVMASQIWNEIESLTKINIPVILTDARISHANAVGYVDNNSYQGSYDLAKYLLGLGHRKIAFIGRNLHFCDQNNKARIDGWRNAMSESGVSDDELDRRLFHVNHSTAEIRALQLKEKAFTAVMANDDNMAMICLCACHAMGIRVPEDLSVTGFSNMEGSEFFVPPLTTVDQKVSMVGYEAARHAGELVTGKRTDLPSLVLPTELVIRESSGPVT